MTGNVLDGKSSLWMNQEAETSHQYIGLLEQLETTGTTLPVDGVGHLSCHLCTFHMIPSNLRRCMWCTIIGARTADCPWALVGHKQLIAPTHWAACVPLFGVPFYLTLTHNRSLNLHLFILKGERHTKWPDVCEHLNIAHTHMSLI